MLIVHLVVVCVCPLLLSAVTPLLAGYVATDKLDPVFSYSSFALSGCLNYGLYKLVQTGGYLAAAGAVVTIAGLVACDFGLRVGLRVGLGIRAGIRQLTSRDGHDEQEDKDGVAGRCCR